MAKQGIGYPGAFNGRLGAAVGYCWNGKWCLRSLPTRVRNPRTEAQVEHREAFKAQVKLAARMRQAVLAGLTHAAREVGMTSYNLFVSINQPAFGMEGGAMTTDYSMLQLSAGPVAPVAFETVAVDEHNVLSVSFEANPTHMRADVYDGVRVYVYSAELGRGYLTAPVYRRSKRLSASLPDVFDGRELHVYAFVQDREGRCSETVYARSESGERSSEVVGVSSEFGVRSSEMGAAPEAQLAVVETSAAAEAQLAAISNNEAAAREAQAAASEWGDDGASRDDGRPPK